MGEGPSAFSVPSVLGCWATEVCWRMSVQDGGEDTLHALKGISAGVGCPGPCLWRGHQHLNPSEKGEHRVHSSRTRAVPGHPVYWLSVLFSNVGTLTLWKGELGQSPVGSMSDSTGPSGSFSVVLLSQLASKALCI